MANPIVTSNAIVEDLGPRFDPIPAKWVLSGAPTTRTRHLIRSNDWTSNNVIWECSAGSFRWYYPKDEGLVVIAGEVFISDETGGPERRLGCGDFAFFPAGCSAIWRVPVSVRKVAVIEEPMWKPLGIALKAWNKLLQSIGLMGRAPL